MTSPNTVANWRTINQTSDSMPQYGPGVNINGGWWGYNAFSDAHTGQQFACYIQPRLPGQLQQDFQGPPGGGTCTLSFWINLFRCTGSCSFQVLVDASTVASSETDITLATPTGSFSYVQCGTTFNVSAGQHTLAFAATTQSSLISIDDICLACS